MKILVAVDGSPYTQKALAYLADHRSMFIEGQELVVLHVCTALPGNVKRHIAKDVIDGYYAEEAAKVFEPVKKLLADHGVSSVTTLERHGHAAEEIVAAAKDLGAGLIVMGTHGHGMFGRALMGSVASKVTVESPVSVLLVK